MYFDEVESDNMFFEVCIAVLLLYDSIGASQILKNVGRNVGEMFRFKTIHSDNITLGNHIIICEPHQYATIFEQINRCAVLFFKKQQFC